MGHVTHCADELVRKSDPSLDGRQLVGWQRDQKDRSTHRTEPSDDRRRAGSGAGAVKSGYSDVFHSDMRSPALAEDI
jgi:hypothetical protein